MSWPTPTDYRHAIQDPRGVLDDDELRHGEVRRDARGLPMLWSGNFASVYRIHCPTTGKTWALKCFTREISARQERYRHIASSLEAARLPFTVPFAYLERGIQVHGQWYPAVKMEWVEGQTLNRFVEESLEKPKMLRQLLELWPKLAGRLRDAGIAHADLQHGNVLLVPTPDGKLALKLIDYDGMYVPALAGTQSGEMGHSNYQHPQRVQQHAYNADVDRFSHLVIYCAVHSLLVGRRELWRFNNDENLLFREDDFRAPEESEVFQTLWKLGDASARSLVGRMALACRQPLDEIPWLDHIVHRGRVRALSHAEQQAAASLMAAGKAAMRSKAAATAATGSTPATPEKTPPSDTRPTATEGTVPTVVPAPAELVAEPGGGMMALARAPLVACLRILRRSLVSVLTFTVRVVDRLFARLVGEENDILRYFLWAASPFLLLLAVWAGNWALTPPPTPSNLQPSAPQTVEAGDESSVALQLQPIAPQTVEAGKPLYVTAMAADSDAWNGKLRYSLDPQSPAGATINPETGELAWTPPPDHPEGEYEVTVSAQGPDQQTAQTTFAVTVTRPPALKQIAADLGNGVTMEMLLIPAGEFVMGLPGKSDGETQHWVRLTKPFYLGKYEVTQEQWETVMGSNPTVAKFRGPKYPASLVSWDDCQAFLEKLNTRQGNPAGKFQLPTEAQWEFACRAGSSTRFCFGDDDRRLGEYAWYAQNSGRQAHPVGEKKPNAWGLYDMHGNVCEWCQDRHVNFYTNAPAVDPTGDDSGSFRVLRGGGWTEDPWECWSGRRGSISHDLRGVSLGLRVSLVPADDGPLPPKPDEPPEAARLIRRIETAVANKQRTVAEILLVRVEKLVPGDPRLKGLREGVKRLAAAAPPKLVEFDRSASAKLPPKPLDPPEVSEATELLRQFETAIANTQHKEAERLLARVEELIPGDPRLDGLRKTLKGLTGRAPPAKFVRVNLSPKVKLDLVLIPAGEFLMGTPGNSDLEQQHRVRITKPFYLGKHEVTQEQWQAVMSNNPSRLKGTKNPIEQVSWSDCKQFLMRLNRKVGGEKFALPTEAQWEYACRAGSTGEFCFGDDATQLGKYAWFGEFRGKTHPVGAKKPNAWGLYDMHGNVWEWCADWHKFGYYGESPADDPPGPDSGQKRVFRGGCWSDDARFCRSAHRGPDSPTTGDDCFGLRVARVAAE